MKMSGIGLVLSGGGAKGAYEIGVWKALEEMNVLPEIDGIFGTSVGALNAVLLETCGAAKAKEIWLKLKKEDFFCLSYDKDYTSDKSVLEKIMWELYPKDIKDYAKNVIFNIAFGSIGGVGLISSLMPFILENGLPFSQKKLAEIIDRNIDFKRLRREIVVFCKNSHKHWETEGFALKQFPAQTQKQIILASSAMPIFYQGTNGIEINGQGYFDGGFRDEKSNTPIEYMHQRGWNRIITVWLNHTPKIRQVAGCKIVNIIPGNSSIGSFFDGTIKVDTAKMKSDMEMGYHDTLAKQAEIDALLAGK